MNLSRAITGLLSSSCRSGKWLSIRQIPFAALQLAALSADAAAPAKRTYRTAKPKPEADPPRVSPAGARTTKPKPETDPPRVSPAGARTTSISVFKEEEAPDLRRPGEIPFQSKVANQVHLIGSVGVPLQLQKLPNGSYAAVSVLAREKTNGFPQFWIPVIFQGELAQIAACHLKENDVIYVTGQLSGDAPPHTIQDACTNIQVLAHSLSFVSDKVDDNMNEKDEPTLGFSDVKSNLPLLHLWNDLLANPHNWWDNRSGNNHSKHAAFKHKDSGQLLWIDESTPEWILSKLETLSVGQKTQGKGKSIDNVKKMEKYVENSWDDLVLNPQNWRDYRMDKQNGLLHPKFPDFKHKDTEKALWLDSAPSWVMAKLDGLVFDRSKITKKCEQSDSIVPSKQNNNGKYFGNSGKYFGNSGKSKQEKYSAAVPKGKNENLWKNLVDNPNEWWDNRSNKLKQNYPDFKRKETGEVLWLSPTTPQWVMAKLPPVNMEKKVNSRKASSSTTTLLS